MGQMITASAPGKVNLYFSVGSLRPDGYHEVISVYQAFDIREFVSGELAETFSVEVEGSIAAEQLSLVPTDESNLVIRAAKAVAKAAKISATPISFKIAKNIPVAGGLAGGSADAAAAMLAAAKLYGCEDLDLAPIAASVGADVAFSLQGKTALGSGIGESLEPLAAAPNWYLIIPNAGGISTPDSFAELDRRRLAEGKNITEIPAIAPDRDFLNQLVSGDYQNLLLHNDLADIAVSKIPDLQNLVNLGASVSGSGPSTFMVFDSEATALSKSAELKAVGIENLVAPGNAEGARLEQF